MFHVSVDVGGHGCVDHNEETDVWPVIVRVLEGVVGSSQSQKSRLDWTKTRGRRDDSLPIGDLVKGGSCHTRVGLFALESPLITQGKCRIYHVNPL